MIRNRIEIDTRLLNEVLNRDYEALRIDEIVKAEEWIKSNPDIARTFACALERAKRPAIEHREDDLKKHFKHHSGHCAVCHIQLIKIVYPLDERVKNNYRYQKWESVRLTACRKHSKEIKDNVYSVRTCKSCNVPFIASGISPFCSLACRSFSDYHQRKQNAQEITCKQCGIEFKPRRKDSIFCSSGCRVQAFRAKGRQSNVTDN